MVLADGNNHIVNIIALLAVAMGAGSAMPPSTCGTTVISTDSCYAGAQ